MMRTRWLVARLARAPTRIAVRILLFNVLLVFLPVAGLLYLETYEQHLLDQQERAMVDAGRVLASGMSEQPLTAESAGALMRRLGQATDARFRVVAPDGSVLADSHAASASSPDGVEEVYAPPAIDPVRSSWLYRTGAVIAGAWRWLIPHAPTLPGTESIAVAPGRLSAPELGTAFRGRYGAATRLSPGGQRSVTLYSALPIRAGGRVTGAVLVSQSTWRILQQIYDVRLRMFSVVVVSLCFAVALVAVASLTIVTPVRRLRDDAESLADRRGRLTRRFRGVGRKDEIGELARALDDLTGRLDAQLRFSERFAADVSHEFRNPLASIRASADLLAEADDPAARDRFRTRIERDIARLERLLEGVRAITLVDTQLEEEPRSVVDLGGLIRECLADRAETVRLDLPAVPILIEVAPDRLRQVIENVIDNALSFSPPREAIDIRVALSDGRATVHVRDHGPGIAPEHLSRIFDRFFSYRPAQPGARDLHTGLGLSIARTIAESYNGTIGASNHPEGGAVISITLPMRSR